MASVVSQALNIFQPNDFTVSTWLLVGAVVQGSFMALVPRNVALLPAVLFLLYRITKAYLTANGFLHNLVQDEIVHGRQTWQIPSADGSVAKSGSRETIVVLVLGATITHPMGRFAPGNEQIGQYFGKMWEDAAINRDKYGFLGNTPMMVTEDDGSRQDVKGINMTWLSYWKTLEGLHKFTRAEAHMKGQLWWERGAQEKHPHLGVMHEVYEVPAGHWENVFHNYRPFGICKRTS